MSAINKEHGARSKKGRSEAEVSHWIESTTRHYTASENFRVLRFQGNFVKHRSEDTEEGSDSTASSSTQFPEPLDGGYGWVIVLASFLIHFICDGISFSFGIMFPEIQEYFKASKTLSGIVGSIFLSIPLLAGPLAAALTDVYDCRRMTFAGGLIAAVGTFLSFFAYDVWLFMVTFAVITGIGLSFCYNTAIVAVTYYFQKKRALATGIAVCGSGTGTFVLAPLIELLFYHFGWRMTLLFIGALLLLLVGCACLIRDLEWPQDTIEYKRRKFIKKTEKERARKGLRSVADDSSVFNMDFAAYSGLDPRPSLSLPEIPTFLRWRLHKVDSSKGDQSVKDAMNEMQETVARSKSVGTFLRSPEEAKKNTALVQEAKLAVRNELAHLDLQVPSAVAPVSTKRLRVWSNASHSMDALDVTSNGLMNDQRNVTKRNFSCGYESESDDDSTESNLGDTSSRLVCLDTNSQKSFGSHSLEATESRVTGSLRGQQTASSAEHQPFINAEEKSKKPCTKMAFREALEAGMMTATNRAALLSTVVGTAGTAQGRVPASNVMTFGWRLEGFGGGMSRRVPSAPAVFCRRKRKSRTIQIAKMMESWWEWLEVMKSLIAVPSFFVFLCSTFILYIFFDIPYVNFPEYAVKELNVTESQASYLVSGIGFFNTVSMLLCGFLADWSKTGERMMQLYGVFISLAGLCVVVAPFITSYFHLLLLCNLYGFFISANYVLASVITVHILCLYDFQTGYGLLCLVEGLGNLIGPALVGFIHDNLGAYRTIFLVGGFGTILSGVMVNLLEIYIRFYGNMRNGNSSDDEELEADSTRQTLLLTDNPWAKSNSSPKMNGRESFLRYSICSAD